MDPKSARDEGPEPLAELVVKARAGDRAAFDRIIGLSSARIFRMAYYRVRSSMDAEDITQDVFIRAWENLPRLSDPERFSPWLYRIAMNRVMDHGRKRKFLDLFRRPAAREDPDGDQEETDFPDTATPSPLTQVMAGEFRERLDAFSRGLSRMEREIFSLRFLDELSLKEIAQTLEKDESTVKTHLYRAISKFRKDREFGSFLSEAAP